MYREVNYIDKDYDILFYFAVYLNKDEFTLLFSQTVAGYIYEYRCMMYYMYASIM
jgi:hypothetical protein